MARSPEPSGYRRRGWGEPCVSGDSLLPGDGKSPSKPSPSMGEGWVGVTPERRGAGRDQTPAPFVIPDLIRN